MAYERERRAVRFSDQDLARMTQLQREVISRAEEMANILARTLALPTFHGKQFVLNLPDASSGNEFVPGQHISDKGDTYCYDIVAKVCCEGPCPCG